MPKFTYVAVATIALFAGAPSLASAASVKELVSESALADFCSNAGIGSETAVSVELSNGSNVSGTIRCEAEDLVVGDVDDKDAGDADAQHGDDGNDASDDGSDDGDHSDSGDAASDDSDDEESGHADDSGSADSDDGDDSEHGEDGGDD